MDYFQKVAKVYVAANANLFILLLVSECLLSEKSGKVVARFVLNQPVVLFRYTEELSVGENKL